jgi:hypothetical protein
LLLKNNLSIDAPAVAFRLYFGVELSLEGVMGSEFWVPKPVRFRTAVHALPPSVRDKVQTILFIQASCFWAESTGY